MKKFISLFALLIFAMSAAYSQSVDEIINANLQARGGAKALTEIKTLSVEMDMSIMGMQMPLKYYVQTPDKSRLEQTQMGQTILVVCNGKSGWVSMQGQVQEIPEEQFGFVNKSNPSIQFLTKNPLIDYKANGFKVTNAGNDVFEGKQCTVLEVDYNDDYIVNIYIDKATNLEVKYEINVPTLAAELENAGDELSEEQAMISASMQPEIFITEWAEYDGIKLPKTTQIKMGEITQTVTITSCKINGSLDAKLFSKPE